MSRGRRAEGFPSHIEHFRIPRKKKKAISIAKKKYVKQNMVKKKYANTPLERYKMAKECIYFNKDTNKCKLIKKGNILETNNCRILETYECVLKDRS